ncbi:hypothetical protein IQ265_05465 [Nodosilinea sp. LEGE 06152]|uniref:hypothetical protein n=1 Tax=Nodosilinea sp. LEGE 06152 TaxID=2777966 RepID=UPI001881F766|nr:hypothetical protein [Nodosilinea sp. LEGE 06152]MBE9156280.1 hypothetical protein [Nodosilinea sp. LEGE 06152]
MAPVQLSFSNLTLADLRPLVTIQDAGVQPYPWTDVSKVTLSATVQRQVADIQNRISQDRLQLMNEATVWARAIYPLLMLAEQDVVRAWAQVPLRAAYPAFGISGVADGVLGKGLAGELEAPYLVVVEAKRGIEAQNPQYQLYGEMLAAARMNWALDGQDTQIIFGCYTVADVWTFVRGQVLGLESNRPSLYLESSQEYSGKLEAETVVKILQQIVAERLETYSQAA